MQIRFWGVRGSLPVGGGAYRHFGGDTACIEVQAGGHVLVLDLGSGARRLGQRLAGCPRPVTVLLSHGHYDHVCGLPFFAPLRRPNGPVRLASAIPGGTRGFVDRLLAPPLFPAAPDLVDPAVRCIDLDPAGTFRPGDGITVTTTPTRHDGGATAFRIEHGGRSLVYGGDHEAGDAAADARLVALMDGADLAILDATGGAPHAAGSGGLGHSSWTDAIDLARRAGVRRAVLSHHHPDSTDAGLARLDVAARTLWPRAALARTGQLIDTAAPRAAPVREGSCHATSTA